MYRIDDVFLVILVSGMQIIGRCHSFDESSITLKLPLKLTINSKKSADMQPVDLLFKFQNLYLKIENIKILTAGPVREQILQTYQEKEKELLPLALDSPKTLNTDTKKSNKCRIIKFSKQH